MEGTRQIEKNWQYDVTNIGKDMCGLGEQRRATEFDS
jgi:hypothetical protein